MRLPRKQPPVCWSSACRAPSAASPPSRARIAPALRLERTIRDLHGLEPDGCPDERRWLDHGRWGLRHPLGERQAADAAGDAYAFLPAEGPPLHQIPVGPVHAGIIEPGHFRFTANGETVVRLEERLGYVHKGIDHLMIGAPIVHAARLAGRVSGDSTVAYALAFARAVEAAQGSEPPVRAVWLRALMAELERLANHLGDIGAICNDASFSLIHAHCGILREHVLRVSNTCFGHRLMMDRVVPGGVAADLGTDGVADLRALLRIIRRRFPELVELYDNTASLQNRTVTTGILERRAGTPVWCWGLCRPRLRADVRCAQGARLRPLHDVVVRCARPERRRCGCARVGAHRGGLPVSGAGRAGPGWAAGRRHHDRWLAAAPTGKGLRWSKASEATSCAWVRLGPGGTIAHCHLRDPSWFQWPLLEAAIEGNIVADFPLCNKSFNCSYSGHDL